MTEFWYAEQGSMSGNSTRSGSFRKVVQPQPQRKEEKWWLPVPCVPHGGLSEKSKKHLRQKHDRANQIHKAAMAINSGILAEMQIPESYMASLPKVECDSVNLFLLKMRNLQLQETLTVSSIFSSLRVGKQLWEIQSTDTCIMQTSSHLIICLILST